MTDQEINEACAWKLGWEFMDVPLYGDVSYKAIKESLLINGERVMDRPVDIPDYCHFIAAAWEVVESFSSKWTISIGKNYGGKWGCCFSGVGKEYAETADTAPMAICLAFLKLP